MRIANLDTYQPAKVPEQITTTVGAQTYGLKMASRISPKNPNFAKVHFRAWRKKRGLTQQRLAELMGIEEETVSRMETGAREAYLGYLGAFAEVIGCTTADLFKDPDEPFASVFAEASQAPFWHEGNQSSLAAPSAKPSLVGQDVDATLIQIINLIQWVRLALRGKARDS